MMLKRNAVLVVVGAVALGLLSVVCLAALLGLGESLPFAVWVPILSRLCLGVAR